VLPADPLPLVEPAPEVDPELPVEPGLLEVDPVVLSEPVPEVLPVPATELLPEADPVLLPELVLAADPVLPVDSVVVDCPCAALPTEFSEPHPLRAKVVAKPPINIGDHLLPKFLILRFAMVPRSARNRAVRRAAFGRRHVPVVERRGGRIPAA